MIEDLEKYKWWKEWKDNDYNKIQNFDIKDIDLNLYFNILQKFDSTKNITINEWLTNWKDIIKRNNNLEQELFLKIFIPKLKQKYSNKSEYLKVIDNLFKWESISKISANFKIFENKIDCTNIEQGSLGTCYFLETISTLSNYGQLLYQLFPKENINNEGFY